MKERDATEMVVLLVGVLLALAVGGCRALTGSLDLAKRRRSPEGRKVSLAAT
jgi:hypothetical protein